MASIAPAKILSQSSFQVPGRLSITEHFFEVPKDYSTPASGTIQVFGRSVRKYEPPIVPKEDKDKDQLPWMVYLQGGPGGACRPPQEYPFVQTLLDRGYQLFFLDQRGTGFSTPITASTLQMRGDTEAQAQYLKLYRADSIVRDCEAIRLALTDGWPEEKRQWSTIGQSFGGFITVTYLSFYPHGLRECLVFGGLQPLVKNPDAVYRATYRKLTERNQAYYRKFPDDIARVKIIMHYLACFGDGTIKLPSQGSLTRRRFQQLGMALGGHGGIDALHNIVLKAALDIDLFGHLTRPTLAAIEAGTSFDNGLLYSILHEPIYCVGQAANWSAHRIRDEFPVYRTDHTAAASDDGPVYFTGEMIYPWMFEDYVELSKVRDVAERIAAESDWPELFDVDQLRKNEVPVYAASYIEDMYVDVNLGLDTARTIRGCKVFNTNMMYHNAISAKMDEVLGKVLQLRDDTLD